MRKGKNSPYKGQPTNGYYLHMGEGGPTLPGTPVYRTQAEVEAANQQARSFFQRHYGHVNMVINPEDVHVASRPGDPVVPYVDPQGRPAQASRATRTLHYRLPSGVSAADVKTHEGEYWYDDPHTGDAVFVAPSALNGRMQQGGTSKANPWTPYLDARMASVVMGELSGRVDRGRQDQYYYNQLSTMGQMNPMPVDGYQPNPYNLYMRMGGNLKYYKGGKRC